MSVKRTFAVPDASVDLSNVRVANVFAIVDGKQVRVGGDEEPVEKVVVRVSPVVKTENVHVRIAEQILFETGAYELGTLGTDRR